MYSGGFVGLAWPHEPCKAHKVIQRLRLTPSLVKYLWAIKIPEISAMPMHQVVDDARYRGYFMAVNSYGWVGKFL